MQIHASAQQQLSIGMPCSSVPARTRVLQSSKINIVRRKVGVWPDLWFLTPQVSSIVYLVLGFHIEANVIVLTVAVDIDKLFSLLIGLVFVSITITSRIKLRSTTSQTAKVRCNIG